MVNWAPAPPEPVVERPVFVPPPPPPPSRVNVAAQPPAGAENTVPFATFTFKVAPVGMGKASERRRNVRDTQNKRKDIGGSRVRR